MPTVYMDARYSSSYDFRLDSIEAVAVRAVRPSPGLPFPVAGTQPIVESFESAAGMPLLLTYLEMDDPIEGSTSNGYRFSTNPASGTQFGAYMYHARTFSWNEELGFGGMTLSSNIGGATVTHITSGSWLRADEPSDGGDPVNFQPALSFTENGVAGDDYNVIAPNIDAIRGAEWSGFNINITQLNSAVTSATQGNSAPLMAILNSYDYDFTGSDYRDLIAGYALGDTLRGMDGNDDLGGRGGNDRLYGGNGDDRIWGDDGHDTLVGGTGTNFLYGGLGNDTYVLDTGLDRIDDASGSNAIQLTHASTINWRSNIFTGDAAGDIFHEEHIQRFYGSQGNDRIFLSAGNTTDSVLRGHGGDDVLRGAAGKDTITGDAGIDFLYGEGGNDYLWGGDNNDFISGDSGFDNVTGGRGDDNLYGGQNSPTYGGVDTVNFDDHIGAFNQGWTINVNTGFATTVASFRLGAFGFLVPVLERDSFSGFEIIVASHANDVVTAGDHVEDPDLAIPRLYGLGGIDTLILNEELYTDRTLPNNLVQIVDLENNANAFRVQNDNVFSGQGQNFGYQFVYQFENVTGTRQVDHLRGSSVANDLKGLGGNDTLNGRLGNDTLTGGLNNDTFVFDTALNLTTNRDSISDYNVASDTIELDNAVFTTIVQNASATGVTMLSKYFASNASGAATTADHRIIYETDTGLLRYDANGSLGGGAGPMIFASLTAGLAMTNADFQII